MKYQQMNIFSLNGVLSSETSLFFNEAENVLHRGLTTQNHDQRDILGYNI